MRTYISLLTRPLDFSTFYIQLGFGLLVSVVAKYLLGVVILISGHELQQYTCQFIIITSVLIAIVCIYLYCQKNLVLVGGFVIFLYVATLSLAMLIRDTSIDGQEYHFEAIYALAHHWNPYHEAYHISSDLAPSPGLQWVVVYPKASWIPAAIDYSAGWPIEAAKGQNAILLLSSLFAVLGLLLKLGYSRLSSAIIATAASANPIALTELFTRMNDGLLASTTLLFLVFVIDWIRSRKPAALIGISATIIFAINLKFSAIPFFVIYCAFSCLAWYKRSGVRSATLAAFGFFCMGVFAILVIGYTPYVENVINHGHPFYPLFGQHSDHIMRLDIMRLNYPETFRRMSKLERFVFSLFAETHSGFTSEPHLKIPFSTSWSGLRYAGNPDPRIAGFGPLYSGALLSAFATAFRTLILHDGKTARATYPALVVAAILISVAIFPENWWARYVPQLWLIPCIIAATAMSLHDRTARFLGWVVLATMILNATAVFATSIWLDVKRDIAVDAQINQMRREGGPFCVFFDSAEARIDLFRKAHLSFTPIPKPMMCAQPQELAGYGPDRTGGEVCQCVPPAH